MKKRIISVLLVCVLAFQFNTIVFGYSTSHPNTHTNTGNQANDIVAIAKSQVGYQETGDNHTKYNAWYYGYDASVAWCAVFISWCANQAGIPTSVIAKTSSAGKNAFSTPTYEFSSHTPKPGDIIYVDNSASGTYNHVGLVVNVDSSYIYTVEGNWGGGSTLVSNVKYNRSNGYSIYESGAHIVLYGVPNYSTASSKPKAISLKRSLYNNIISEGVKFDFQYENAEWAAIVIRKDGVRKHVETVTGKYTYTHKFTETGTYIIQLELWNGEYCDTIQTQINVYDAKPSNISITADKTYVVPNEVISFTFTQKDSSWWYFIVKKDGERLLTEEVTGKYSHTYSFAKEGEYEVVISSGNKCGWTDKSIWITVSNTPGKPKLNYVQNYYNSETGTYFEWDETSATTHYNLYINKKDESGQYKTYENIFYAKTEMTRMLEPGEYEVVLQSINSNEWDNVNDTWAFKNSDVYRFTVTDGYVPAYETEYNGHRYVLFDYSVTWHDAKRICGELGGYLATITTDEEFKKVKSIIPNGSKNDYFVGATDMYNEGTWLWTAGEHWAYNGLWKSGEPNNYLNNEHYLTIDSAGGVDVASKTIAKRGFLCEFSDMLDAEECKPTHTAVYNGSTYLLFDYDATWHSAKKFCEELGGHLATISSEEEYEVIKEIILNGNRSDYFLGATDEAKEGEWVWITGEQWSYSGFWGSGEPNNYYNTEQYLTLGNYGVDVASKALSYRGFICEVEDSITISKISKRGTKHIIKTNYYNISEPCKFVFAGYKDKELVAIESKTRREILDSVTLSGDFDEIKVMVWETVSNLKPLTFVEIIPSSEFIIE